MNLEPAFTEHKLKIRSSKRPRYTLAADALIQEHYPKETPVEWIAEQLHRTPKQIRDRAHRLGLKRPPDTILTPAQVADLKRMWEGGTCREVIAKRLGLTVERTRKQASMNGFRRPQWYVKKVRFEAAQKKADCRVVEHGLPSAILPENLIARIYAGQRYEDVRLRS